MRAAALSPPALQAQHDQHPADHHNLQHGAPENSHSQTFQRIDGHAPNHQVPVAEKHGQIHTAQNGHRGGTAHDGKKSGLGADGPVVRGPGHEPVPGRYGARGDGEDHSLRVAEDQQKDADQEEKTSVRNRGEQRTRQEMRDGGSGGESRSDEKDQTVKLRPGVPASDQRQKQDQSRGKLEKKESE